MKGKAAAYKIRHGNILLMADADGPGWRDEQIAQVLSVHLNSVHLNTVRGVRQRAVEQGLEAAVARKPQARPSRVHRC